MNVTEVESALIGLSAAHPTICKLVTLPNLTVEGMRTTHAVVLGTKAANTVDAYYLTGGVHAREWGSCEIMVNMATDLCDAYAGGTGIGYGGKYFSAAEVKALIDGFATGETSGPVAAMQPQVDAWFAHDRMEEIVASLKRDGSELAQATLKTLSEKSPRGMVVTLKLLRLARSSSSLEACLVREYRAALEVFRSDDFREGVRAAVIDKDRNPKWSPSQIEDVTPAMVAPYFAEIGADELVFDQEK